MIQKYQKKLSRQKYNSKNYQKTLKKYYKWIRRKNNKIQNAYHQLSKHLVKKIRHNRNGKPKHTRNVSTKKWAPKLQKIGLYKLQTMIKYKSQWYGKKFTQADPFPIQPTMQQLRIQKTRPNTKN